MAPERFTGGEVGPAADVYSLACLLYECLTGAPPFETGELSQLMGSHIMSPPPKPSESRPILNDAFDAVIARGMAKKPEARYASAGELGRAACAAAGTPRCPRRPTRSAKAGEHSPIRRHAHSRHGRHIITRPRGDVSGAQWTIAGAIAVMFAVAGGAVMWLLLGENRTHDVGPDNPPHRPSANRQLVRQRRRRGPR